MAKFKFTVKTNIAGSAVEEEYEVPDDDLEGLNENEREQMIAQHYAEWVAENTDGGWEESE